MSSRKHVHFSEKRYQEASIETWTLPSPNERTIESNTRYKGK